MIETHRGTVLGNEIRLATTPSFAIGQSVEVTLRPVSSDTSLGLTTKPFGESERRRFEEVILACEGAWADDPEDLETMLAEFRKWRLNDRGPIEP